MTPTFVAFFFGIFQLFGGLALGRGLSSKRFSLAFLGALFGIVAAFFDWFFLIREGLVALGILSIGVFILAAAPTFVFWRGAWMERNEKSIITLIMGFVVVALGIGVAPILIKQARAHELTSADWFFGSCIGIMPFLVGINFILTATKALRRKKTFDEVADEERADAH